MRNGDYHGEELRKWSQVAWHYSTVDESVMS